MSIYYRMKKHSTSPFIRQKQMSCHLHHLEWIKFNYENIKYWQGCGATENHGEKFFGSFLFN